MLQRIPRDQVKVGMYLFGFGGSWFSHPFWRAKFLLTSSNDVERVRCSGVPYVLIDDERGDGVEQQPKACPSPSNQSEAASQASQRKNHKRRSTDTNDKNERERQKAAMLASRSQKVMRGVFEDARLGCAVHSPSMHVVVDEITEAVTKDAQVLLKVTRLKNKDDYTYLHSVAVCALMVCVAQHLELGAAEIQDLGMAGLLHDIGKIGIPDQILNKQGHLTDSEFSNVRSHPEHGYQLLAGSPGIPDKALDVCRHHHEKIDGSGYPFGLPHDEISFAARLGAVCDVYDALTSDRAYKRAWSPQKALGEMWQWQGHFDREVLLALMQAINIFPAGALVKLANGRLALVLEYSGYKAGPIGTTFYCTLDSNFIKPQRVSFGKRRGEHKIVSIEEPSAWDFGEWDKIKATLLQI